MKDSPEKIQWHPAFAAAIGLEFRDDYKDVIIQQEYNLSKEPIRIDLLISRTDGNFRRFNNEIGHIMKSYNIIEYKSPEDSFNIDDYYKTIGYAGLYKGMGEYVNKIPAREVTVSMFCTRKPVKMFNMLKEDGTIIEQRYPGVYYIKGNTLFPVQIVVVKELNSTLHSSLRVLSDSADREDVETFLQNSVKTSEPWEREDIDAVLQASVSANKELYEEIRRDSGMCQALRELMKDEIDKEIEGAEAGIIKNMYNNGVTPEQISSMTDMELDKVKRIIYGNKSVVV
ncbi:MAG: hypothetical protein PUE32_02400 [Clostridia bacterium]|nr:hypothetical protein [Clostridia bacterium]